jgi:hypothetical protein
MIVLFLGPKLQPLLLALKLVHTSAIIALS